VKLSFDRALYLCTDAERLERQLAGEQLTLADVGALADSVSTDEMTPAWACYYYDETLADYCLVGFRGGVIGTRAVRAGGFSVLVGGESFGCGSSRETAPFAQRACGIRLVVAASFERIYRQNCHNLGIYTSTSFELLERAVRAEPIDSEELLADLDRVSQRVVSFGGLCAYARARLRGEDTWLAPTRGPQPQTLVERILAAHLSGGSATQTLAPGDVGFVRADVRFSHDYVTAMIDAQLRAGFGEASELSEPESIFLFRDHLALLARSMPAEQRRLGLLDQAQELAEIQRQFAARHALKLFDERPEGGSEGICHNLVIEQLALPGDVVVGTDSHTCMAGVLGCVAFGVGSTDMAAGFITRDFRVRVPETVRLELRGRLAPFVAAKDAWLTLLAREDVRAGLLRGRVIELTGDGYASLPLDERATFTNMAAEAGAFTAIGEADEVVVEFLERERGVAREALDAKLLRADPDATYAARIQLELDRVEPMLALPGDPKNGVSARQLLNGRPPIAIDIAYGGSCTGGKRADMDMYAAVLSAARARGERVAAGVEFFIQFGSLAIRRYAEARGYPELFSEMGATLLEPSCGACIRAGPGVSSRPEQVTVSAVNRNFPGRSGPGQVYLASPYVVAESAIRGVLASPNPFSEHTE
jgi:3-isopropylmalate/(R)-2-methylmalate dehydratase large subunit